MRLKEQSVLNIKGKKIMKKYIVLIDGVFINGKEYNNGEVVELIDLSSVDKTHYLELLTEGDNNELIETGVIVDKSEQTNKPNKKGKRGNKQW